MEERSKLVAARKRRFTHWSRRKVARQIGIGENTLYCLEKGLSKPRGDTILLLSDAYGVDARDLGFEDDQPAQNPPASASSAPPEVTIMTDTITSSLKQDLTVHLMNIVLFEKQIDVVQGQIDKAVQDYEALIREDLDCLISRRNALRSLVLLPIGLCVATSTQHTTRHVDDILIQCAAGIAACRHFSNGKELVLARDALSNYIAALKVIIQQSERNKKTAADLLMQCLMLKAELARDVENIEQSIAYLTQAISYGEISQNVLLEALTWRTLAATYYYAEQWSNCLHATEKALKTMKLAPKGTFPLDAQSFINAGAATYFAVNGKETQAYDAISSARRTYEMQAHDAPKWAAHSEGNLIHNEAISAYYLGKHGQAAGSMQKLRLMPAHSMSEVSEYRFDTVRVEVMRDDQPRNIELCIEQWTQGVQEARALQSKQRQLEARQTYAMLRAAWPQEQAIKDLKSLLTF